MSNRLFAAALVGVILLVILVFLQPEVEERLLPTLEAAWVAIEVGGDGVAKIGEAIELEAGVEFRLHAVIEAEVVGGATIYYTEAPALEISGVAVDPKRLRPWRRSSEARVRWFTVEGHPPYIELASPADLERFALSDIYRADWPLAWSVPGILRPARRGSGEVATTRERYRGADTFGTQRYLVSLEIYRVTDELFPSQTLRSPGPEAFPDALDTIATVRRILPEPLVAASRIFGLTQMEVTAGPNAQELQRQVAELSRRGLAWSRVTLLRDHLEAVERRLGDLEFRDVDLAEENPRWGEDVAPGDLLRAGDRFVILLEDAGSDGQPGRLDHSDLCLDFALGASVRPLSEVFSGDGVLELATLD